MFLTPGQLAGQMHAPRIHFKEHMHTEKTRLQHQIWVNFRTYNLLPSLLRAGFGGRWLVCETGLATQLFFSSFCPMIWGSIFGQHGRSCNDSLRARPASPPKVYLLKVSLHNQNHMRSTQRLRLQAYTHTMRAHSHEARNACF